MTAVFNRGAVMSRTMAVSSLMIAGSISAPCLSQAQNAGFTDALLGRVRMAAHAVPGDLPNTVRYLKFAGFKTPLSGAVEGAENDTVSGVYSVFQVRYADRWVMVDAGVDREV